MWRTGQSWGSKENPLLVTIVVEGAAPPDDQGRREDDRLVGCASPRDAAYICRCVNESHQRHVAEMMRRHAASLRAAAEE